MSFTESIRVCFQQYNNISGRASRSEFWWFYLFTVLVNLVTSWIPFAGFVGFLGFLLPTIAVTTRRLHDTDRTGWWQLVPLMPVLAGMVLLFLSYFTIFPLGTSIMGALIAVLGFFIGFVVLLVFMIQSGTPGPNQYGPNPLEQQQGRGSSGYTQTVNPSRPPPRAAAMISRLMMSHFRLLSPKADLWSAYSAPSAVGNCSRARASAWPVVRPSELGAA